MISVMLVLTGCSGISKANTLDETAHTLNGHEPAGDKNRYCTYLSRRLASGAATNKMTRTLESIYERRCLGHAPAGNQTAASSGAYQGLCLQFVDEVARKSDVPDVVIAAVVHYESRDRPRAKSSANCMGCGQLSRPVIDMYKIADPYDPRENMRGTAAYLKHLHLKFHGVWARAIAAYNTGAGRIGRSGDLSRDIPNKRYVCEVYRRIPGWKARSVEGKLGCKLAYIELRNRVPGKQRNLAPDRKDPPRPRSTTHLDPTHPVLSQQWVHPLKSTEIPTKPSAKFGARRTRAGKRKDRCRGGHCGIDIGRKGQPVYAILDGRVVKAARYNASYSGKHMVLGHGPDQSVYCHLSRLAPGLNKGDEIKAGQLIGWVGRTGIRYSKAHLHLNVLAGKVHVDPEPMLRRARTM